MISPVLQLLVQCYGDTKESVIYLFILLQCGLVKILTGPLGESFREAVTFELRVKENTFSHRKE